MQNSSLEAFGDRMIELFPKLMREITRYEHNYLTEGVITVPQVWALDYLCRHEAASMHELAGFMRLKLSSATGLVDRMVKHGLVKRCRCEVDRRVVRVSITAKGKKILPQIYKQKRKGIIKLFAALSSKERAQYLSLVEKLVQQLASREPGS